MDEFLLVDEEIKERGKTTKRGREGEKGGGMNDKKVSQTLKE